MTDVEARALAESGTDPERPTRMGRSARERQLLDCAVRLYRDAPQAEVSVEAVARAAGVTPGLVHHYFGNRRGLYVAVVREVLRGPELPVPEYVRDASPEDRLSQSIDRWLDFVEENKETWLATVGLEGLGRDPEVEELVRRVREGTIDRVIAVLGLGPPETVSSTMRAVIRSYGGLAEFTARQWLEGTGLDREQARVLLLRSLLHLVEVVEPLVEASGQRGAGNDESRR